MTTITCTECGGACEEGFIADVTYGGIVLPKWATKIKGSLIFTRLENSRNVITYRCTNCGALKSYAK
jgi:hypothetical protein